jgi:hypothetical protein
MRIILFILLLCLCVVLSAHADSTDVKQKKDTILFIPQAGRADSSAIISPTDLEKQLTQTPTVALFKSMIVPGLGQFGNRKYFKTVLFAGLETWFIAEVITYGKKASDFQKQYKAETDINARNAYYDKYKNKKSARNKYLWFAAINSFVSMFDAYVDAHMSGAPSDKRNKKFQLSVVPTIDGGAQASLAFNF